MLKLKSKELIESSCDERHNKSSYAKKFKENLLLETYVDNLQRKTLGKQDVRLLDVLGFGECLSILTKQKDKENKDKEIAARRKTGNNRNLTARLGINDSDGDTDKRNPLADVYREQW